MTHRESNYFTLTLESLRAIGGWAADSAERALAVYETHLPSKRDLTDDRRCGRGQDAPILPVP